MLPSNRKEEKILKEAVIKEIDYLIEYHRTEIRRLKNQKVTIEEDWLYDE